MILQRRSFLKWSSLATASLFVPRFLNGMMQPGTATVPKGNKVLVVLQLSGGNDGLNTVIPFANDIYHNARPVIGFKKDKVLQLNDEAGLHPSLPLFRSLYDEGNLGILNNVGYPAPDKSHFRSMDIWQSASNSDIYLQTGWIGRYLDAQCANCAMLVQALELDDTLSLALRGEYQKALALKSPAALNANANDAFLKALAKNYSTGNAHDLEHHNPVDYLYRTMAATQSSASYIFEKSNTKQTATLYPKSQLGKSLKTIASLILSDIDTQVYYVSVGSFDSHVNQIGLQAGLFSAINDALDAFIKDLKANNRFDDVLLFTFSEFGRRVSQNASNGTDHGTANNMFFISGGLKEKGLLNDMPDLNDLYDGDLKYKVDFKSVYATVLKKWLGADDEKILGKKTEYLSFI